MKKLFTPLYDRLLVQRDEEVTTLAGGIIIPDNSAEKPQEGTVLEIGHGRLLESGVTVPMIVRVGDRIMFGKYAGTEIKLGGKEYLIMQEVEIYGILPKSKGDISE
jgi:chaperonin GroES